MASIEPKQRESMKDLMHIANGGLPFGGVGHGVLEITTVSPASERSLTTRS